MDTPYHNEGRSAAPSAEAQPRAGAPRTVIRGESREDSPTSHKALTDWLNVSFPFDPKRLDPKFFFDCFSEVTGGVFGGMTDRERGLHGWRSSFAFDRGNVLFACGGQRDTAFLSLSGEGCAFVTDWGKLSNLLKADLRGHITRWDGAADDFEGKHSVDLAVVLYQLGGFKSGGRQPNPRQFGNWLTPDTLGRTFQVGSRENGKLARIYEKGKQLGEPSNPWVRWEVELHAVDRVIPWDVLENPGYYVAGAYPCFDWISSEASRIRTVKAQDAISYSRLKHVSSVAYGALINVMLQREGSAERVVELLRRDGIPRRLAFSEDYLRLQGGGDDV